MIQIVAAIGNLLPAIVGKRFSYATAKVVGWIILGLLLIAVLSLGKCAYDRSVVNHYKAEQEAKAAAATDKAADQRTKDNQINTQSEKELNDAINTAEPGGTLSPAAHALACERLHKAGRDPAAC